MGDKIYISSYSRAEALQDGLLIDVSEMAREAGFKVPVAVTHALWHVYIIPHPEARGQSEAGRLWDVLTVARAYAKYAKTHEMLFGIDFIMGKTTMENVTLKSHILPGDNQEPVMTIMLQNED